MKTVGSAAAFMKHTLFVFVLPSVARLLFLLVLLFMLKSSIMTHFPFLCVYVHFRIISFLHTISSLACSLIAPYLHSVSDKDRMKEKQEEAESSFFPQEATLHKICFVLY